MVFEAIVRAGKGHVGGALSCVDILVALYHGGALRWEPTGRTPRSSRTRCENRLRIARPSPRYRCWPRFGREEGRDCLTVALLGHGECCQGSIWEAFLFAAHHQLNRLVAIIDRNRQITLDYTSDEHCAFTTRARWPRHVCRVRPSDTKTLNRSAIHWI